jgi:hypothetical protein
VPATATLSFYQPIFLASVFDIAALAGHWRDDGRLHGGVQALFDLVIEKAATVNLPITRGALEGIRSRPTIYISRFLVLLAACRVRTAHVATRLSCAAQARPRGAQPSGRDQRVALRLARDGVAFDRAGDVMQPLGRFLSRRASAAGIIGTQSGR